MWCWRGTGTFSSNFGALGQRRFHPFDNFREEFVLRLAGELNRRRHFPPVVTHIRPHPGESLLPGRLHQRQQLFRAVERIPRVVVTFEADLQHRQFAKPRTRSSILFDRLCSSKMWQVVIPVKQLQHMRRHLHAGIEPSANFKRLPLYPTPAGLHIGPAASRERATHDRQPWIRF